MFSNDNIETVPSWGISSHHYIGASKPIYPEIRLKKLPFYDDLATLVKPSSLWQINNQGVKAVSFNFTLTPQQATQIATNRFVRDGSTIEHSIQVQVRFCLLESSCEQEDRFPPNAFITVNNEVCHIPDSILENSPARPINVTSNVKLSPDVMNTITVKWYPTFNQKYCIAVYLVKKITSSQLLYRLKTKGIKSADVTRELIQEKLSEDADGEIETTALKVSLICPLGKMRISTPCRASTCSHIQCFDAYIYLQLNEHQPTWKCPICDEPASYDNLVIDGYFLEVLASLVLFEDEEIQLHKDGSWSRQTGSRVETVDLTASDSDDGMPLAKRKTPATENLTPSPVALRINGPKFIVQVDKGVKPVRVKKKYKKIRHKLEKSLR